MPVRSQPGRSEPVALEGADRQLAHRARHQRTHQSGEQPDQDGQESGSDSVSSPTTASEHSSTPANPTGTYSPPLHPTETRRTGRTARSKPLRAARDLLAPRARSRVATQEPFICVRRVLSPPHSQHPGPERADQWFRSVRAVEPVGGKDRSSLIRPRPPTRHH